MFQRIANAYNSGKNIVIELTDKNQFKDHTLIAALILAFDSEGASTLKFQFSPTNTLRSKEMLIEELEIQDIVGNRAGTPINFITPPGQRVPGSDVIRKPILSPIIKSGFTVWLYAHEGVGKGWLGLVVAHCVATGRSLFDRFHAVEKGNVFLIDGESQPDMFEERRSQVAVGFGDPPDRLPFSVKPAKTHDNPTGTLDLLDPDLQEQFAAALPRFDLVIIDNFYSLTNLGNNIKPFLEWLRQWTNKGVSFLVIDSDGELQGSRDKRRAADLCMKLERQEDQSLLLSFVKSRYLGQDDTQPIHFQMDITADSCCLEVIHDRGAEPQTLSEGMKRQVIAYAMEQSGKKAEEIGDIMGYGHSSVYKWLGEAKKILNGKSMDIAANETGLFRAEIERLKSLSDDALVAEAKRLAKKE